MKFTGYQLLLEIKDLDKNVIPERDERGQIIKNNGVDKPLTVKAVVRTALVANLQSVQEDENRKYNNYVLAGKVLNMDPEGELDISAEDVAHIKKKVSLCWGIEVYGFVADVLEGRNKDYRRTEQEG